MTTTTTITTTASLSLYSGVLYHDGEVCLFPLDGGYVVQPCDGLEDVELTASLFNLLPLYRDNLGEDLDTDDLSQEYLAQLYADLGTDVPQGFWDEDGVLYRTTDGCVVFEERPAYAADEPELWVRQLGAYLGLELWYSWALSQRATGRPRYAGDWNLAGLHTELCAEQQAGFSWLAVDTDM